MRHMNRYRNYEQYYIYGSQLHAVDRVECATSEPIEIEMKHIRNL